jgi:hypothetical protein
MAAEQNKLLVRRLVEAVNQRNLDVLNEVADGKLARAARHWIGPFTESFPDFKMDILDLISERDKVSAHFRCSGTHPSIPISGKSRPSRLPAPAPASNPSQRGLPHPAA